MSLSTVLPQGDLAHPSKPWLALALTFLMLGVGYALPFPLVPAPPAGLWQGSIAPEILNLYALTVFAGWGHFIYAWRGQIQGTARLSSDKRAFFWISILVSLVVLLALRVALGVQLFSVLVWIWFIAHFVKAELVFGKMSQSAVGSHVASSSIAWQPVAAFAWLSLVLFNVAGIQQHRWLLFCGCLVLALAILLTGGWTRLAAGSSFLPALALFFDGEALVWGTYGQYMHPMFRIGVYVFHVVGASFFHYFGSYAFGYARSNHDRWLRPIQVAVVNLAVIVCCSAVA